MVDVAQVKLWGKKVGAIAWNKEMNFASFQYYPEFLSDNLNISPIQMPLENSNGRIFSFPGLNEETYYGLPGLLSDALPDDFGNMLINQWLIQNNIDKSRFNPIDRLCYMGKRGMGALEFEPSIRKKSDFSNKIEVGKLVDLAQQILDRRNVLEINIKDKKGLDELIKVGTSAGGQRPKAIIAFNKKTNEVRSGQVKAIDGFEQFILKFDSVSNKELSGPEGYGRIEYAYYLMALDCGIEMTESFLFEEENRAHFMTKRFDRINANDKIHMQTLCAIAHYDYRSPGSFSYEDAFQIMRLLKLPHDQAKNLFKRMVFNVLAKNQDDHTKNISFLMDKNGKWKLAPAYDVTYSYNPTGIWTNQHQMTINGKRDDFTVHDLIQVGKKVNLHNSMGIINEIRDVIDNWFEYSKVAGIPKKQAGKLKEAFRVDMK